MEYDEINHRLDNILENYDKCFYDSIAIKSNIERLKSSIEELELTTIKSGTTRIFDDEKNKENDFITDETQQYKAVMPVWDTDCVVYYTDSEGNIVPCPDKKVGR